MAKTRKKKTGTADAIHIDINSHNAKDNAKYKMMDESGSKPHRAKYFVEYQLNNNTVIKYFEKLPKDKYKGSDGIYYLMMLTDHGTSLIPIINIKTGKPVKK